MAGVLARGLVGVVVTIKRHYSEWEKNNERGQRLTGRVDTLKKMLEGMGEDWHGKEAPERIAGALEGVAAELRRVDALFEDLHRMNLLVQMFKAPSTADKYHDIERNLDYAVDVLALAQNWNLLQESGEFQSRMLQEMGVLISKMDTLTIQQEVILKLIRGKQDIDGGEEYLRYNEEMMEFLQDQLKKMDDEVLSTEAYQELLQKVQRGEPLDEGKTREDWQESTRKLAEHRKLGHLLISRHKKPFDLTTFYKVSEARKAVEMICEVLQTFAKEWKFTSVEIQKVVPSDSVHRDRYKLMGYLMYVLKKGSCTFENDHQREEWTEIKGSTKGWLQMLPMAVQHDDLELGEHVSGRVFKGTWENRVDPVAVKRLSKEEDPANLELEDFAEFFSAIVALVRITSEHVVSIIGATETGMILMELGHCDLQRWLEDGQHKLSTKLGLLLQAATGLQDVHDHEFVHRAVRTRNFVLFGDEASPKVKICGFSLAIKKQKDGDSMTVRTYTEKGNAWIAPEIFDGKAYSTASDIYSFGVVLHHVVGGLYPYGRRTAEGIVLADVRAGKLPDLPSGMDLPEELLTLMKKCCAKEPIHRPKDMQEVCDGLKAICDDPKSNL